MLKERIVRLSEEALCRSTATGIRDEEVVDRRQRAQALMGDMVKAMMEERKTTVAAFYTGTRRLEEQRASFRERIQGCPLCVIQAHKKRICGC